MKVVFAVSVVVLCKLQEYLWVLHVLYEFSLNNAFKIIWDVQFWCVYTCLCFKHVSCVSKPHFVSYLIIEVDLGYLLYNCFFQAVLTTVFRYFLGCLYAQFALDKVVVLLRFESLIQNGFHV